MIRTVLCLMVLNGILAVNFNNDPVIKLLQEYVRINSTSNSDLTSTVEFWKRLAEKETVPLSVFEFVKGYPVVVMRWRGTDPSLSSVMLNSHLDVVPAQEQDGWKYPPFSAHIDEKGDIYGRGIQDMKSVAIQQFEALRRLKSKNISLLRNVYMTLMPDEEVGGKNGMLKFIKTKHFAAMRVGVQLDEGWALPLPSKITVFAQDKATWRFRVDCFGNAMHASLLPPTNTTAMGKCLRVMEQVYKFRDEQYKIAKTAGLSDAGSYTTIALNILRGGTAVNIIARRVSMVFDARLSTTVDEHEFLVQLKQWIHNAGDNITLTFLEKDNQTPASITNNSSPYWRALTKAAQKMNVTLQPIVATGATDGRYLRAIGIPSFGLSPMMNSPLLAHMVNERLNAAIFLQGLDIYEQIVKNLANIPANEVSDDSSVYVSRK